MFGKEVYIARRKALMERLAGEKGVALFLGNVEAPAQYKDNCYKWRQDSNWLYFFGIDEPRFAATIDLESGEETIYADDFSIDDIIWTGPMPSVQSQAEAVGVSRTAPYSALREAVRGRKVHFLPTSRYYNAMLMASLLGLDPSEVTSAGKKGCSKASRSLVEAVIAMRLVKEDREIELIDNACAIGYEMHATARKNIRPGIVEQEIDSHDCTVVPGKLMVIDAGAENNMHYASDFTRTYPTSGRFSGMQRDIYQTVYECNELAFGMTRPGVAYRDVHLAVAEHILDNLGQLGLVSGDPAELAARGIAGLFMPHGLGHNMGLDVHDMEDLGEDLVGYDPDQSRSAQLGLGSLRMARRLVPGNVITDEPGIYFIPDLIRLWKRDGTDGGCVNYSKLEPYFDFGGIRLEDDVLVTADGARRLGPKRLPIAPDEVEEAMSKD